MNLTIQSIVSPKNKHASKVIFKSIPLSMNRIRLDEDRKILNKMIKPFDKMLFKIKEISFNMICCPDENLTMGSDDQQNHAKTNERSRTSFLLGETEITQELYEAVMGHNPSYFNKNGAKNPVEQVNWYDAIMFCNKLSQILEKIPYYQLSKIKYNDDNRTKISSADIDTNNRSNGFRLPTNKQWKHAAKSGTNNKWSGCNTERELKNYASIEDNSSQTTPVKSHKANEWGFYDMTGNVLEWCFDRVDTYPSVNGGNWMSSPDDCYTNDTGFITSDISANGIGFRVALPID